MLKVLMLISQFYPVIGGAEKQAEKLARALLRKGIHVEVMTQCLGKQWPLEETLDGLKIRRFRVFDLSRVGINYKGSGPFNWLLRIAQIPAIIRRAMTEFDVLHVHIASPLAYFGARAAKKLNKPVVCKIAAGGRYLDLKKVRDRSFFGPWFEKSLIKTVDKWIAVSDEIASGLMSLGIPSDLVARIPNGVEVPPVPKREGDLATRFLYLGRLTEDRDLTTLIEAFGELLEENHQCELAVVGDGEKKHELVNKVESKPLLKKRVHLIGFTNPDGWLEWADALVQPSLSEGMSNAILEAMAWALACIGNDIPPNREVLDNGRVGILVQPKNKTELRFAMKRLATEKGLARYLGTLGRARVERYYDINMVADRYLDLYESLLKK